MSKNLKPLDELFNIGASIDYLYVSQLENFKNHPFSVVTDEKMEKLVESVKANGIITPVIVREKENGKYELISGHRRTFAARQAGIEKIPAVVKNMTDEEAVIAMVDANEQRENIKPSEKAFAYKMKLEAIRKQGQRSDLTSGQLVPKLDGSRSTAEIGEAAGESYKTVQRYIRLTKLIPELINLVDAEKIKLIPAVSISYLSEEAQSNLYEALEMHGKYSVSVAKAKKIKESFNAGFFETEDFLEIISPAESKEENFLCVRINVDIPYEIADKISEKHLIGICNNYINKVMKQGRIV